MYRHELLKFTRTNLYPGIFTTSGKMRAYLDPLKRAVLEVDELAGLGLSLLG
jgi:hypothetical protein